MTKKIEHALTVGREPTKKIERTFTAQFTTEPRACAVQPYTKLTKAGTPVIVVIPSEDTAITDDDADEVIDLLCEFADAFRAAREDARRCSHSALEVRRHEQTGEELSFCKQCGHEVRAVR